MRTLSIGAAALVIVAAFAPTACGPSRSNEDAGFDSGIGSGCVGMCNPPKDGGTDGGGNNNNPDGGGNTGDGGSGYDGGLLTVTLQDLRGPNVPFGAHVEVADVVVHTVAYSRQSSMNNAWRADFWVSDPANPPYGMWISKFYSDTPEQYLPQPGDQITINGWFGTERSFEFPVGYRRIIANEYPKAGLMSLTKTSTVTAPTPISVSAGNFGNADGGAARPNPEYAGTLVHVTGPVEIIDATPTAMQRVSALPDDDRYYGFELAGGILVSDFEVEEPKDGGATCRWRQIAADAGTFGQKVVFNGGVRGVWDTYTYPSCQDGGTDVFNCFKNSGKVPGTNNNYTHVIYPTSCDDYIDPVVQ